MCINIKRNKICEVLATRTTLVNSIHSLRVFSFHGIADKEEKYMLSPALPIKGQHIEVCLQVLRRTTACVENGSVKLFFCACNPIN